MQPKYPQVQGRLVDLLGHDGKRVVVSLPRVCEAMRRAGLSDVEIAAYVAEAKAADHRHLLLTTKRWVDVV